MRIFNCFYRWSFIALIAIGVRPAQAEPATPHVLVLASYHVGMQWEDSLINGLRDTIGDNAELVFCHLDIKRYPDRSREPLLLAQVQSMAELSRPTAIVALEDYAWTLAIEHRAQLFPELPIIFAGVNNWTNGSVRPQNTTGAVEAFDAKGTVELALQLHPKANRLVILNDPSETGLANHALLDRFLPELLGSRKLLYLGDDETFEQAEATLKTLNPKNDVVLLLNWNLDTTGQTRSHEEAAARIRSLCAAPVYAVWDLFSGLGIVGGRLLDGRVHGHQAGEMLLKVLQGTPADDIPIETFSRTQLTLDDRQLRRFKIDRHRIPAEATLIHQPTSFISLYRNELIATAVIMLVLILLLLLLTVLLFQKRRLAAELDRKSRFLTSIFQLSPDAVFVKQKDGRLLLASQTYAALFNRTPETLIGLKDSELTQTPALADAWHTRREAVLNNSSKDATEPIREILTGPDGQSLVFSTKLTRIDLSDHSEPLILGVMRDITDELHRQSELEKARQLEAVGRLAGGMAHDFNNLLIPIICGAELVAEQATPSIQKLIGNILDAGIKAKELTRQLLTYCRSEKVPEERINPAEILHSMKKMLRRLVREDIDIVFDAESSLCLIIGDRNQLERVLMNLVLNAEDALPHGGKITITCSTLHITEPTADDIKPGDWLYLSVHDTGTGMPPDVVKRLFEPFFTTKENGRGTGLGLYTSNETIRQHNGHIRVSSSEGHGTLFKIYLPAAANQNPAEQPASRKTPSAAFPAVIAVAEDESAVHELTCLMLEKLGYQVVTEPSATALLERIQAEKQHIDLLLTDVIMPDLSGPELANRLTQLQPGLKVLFTSGYTTGILKAYGIPEDEEHLLVKPFQLHALGVILHKILNPSSEKNI